MFASPIWLQPFTSYHYLHLLIHANIPHILQKIAPLLFASFAKDPPPGGIHPPFRNLLPQGGPPPLRNLFPHSPRLLPIGDLHYRFASKIIPLASIDTTHCISPLINLFVCMLTTYLQCIFLKSPELPNSISQYYAIHTYSIS